jgi:hypothetical protein
MHVLVVSTISDKDLFWGALKRAFGKLPREAS